MEEKNKVNAEIHYEIGLIKITSVTAIHKVSVENTSHWNIYKSSEN